MPRGKAGVSGLTTFLLLMLLLLPPPATSCVALPALMQSCAKNTVTDDQFEPAFASAHDMFSSPDACVAKPGYGWTDNVASACPKGWYKTGYNNMECVSCGEGLTTADVASSDPSQCITLPGWVRLSDGDAYAVPCPIGTWSAGAGAPCTPCPTGSTTEYPTASDLSQCSICSPGWGGNAAAAGNDPRCVQCSTGFFGPGGSDDACIACANSEVSAVGASDSSDCFDEFLPPHQLRVYVCCYVLVTATKGALLSHCRSWRRCRLPLARSCVACLLLWHG